MSELWLPGVAGPQDDFVARLNVRIEQFHGTAPTQVEVELREGSRAAVEAISPEPGYGFVTIRPQPDGDGAEEWIVPVTSIARITLRTAETEGPFGFRAASA